MKEERTNQKRNRTKNQESKEVDEQNVTNHCRVEKWPFNEAHDSFAFAGKEFQKRNQHKEGRTLEHFSLDGKPKGRSISQTRGSCRFRREPSRES